MRKLSFGFILLLIFYGNLSAQSWQRMQSWGLDLETISWLDENNGWAAGESLLIRSSDGGLTWVEDEFLPEERILDITFFNENLGLAAGENSYALITQNGGGSWAPLNIPASGDLHGISAFNQDLIFVYGKNEIFISTNQGQSWTELNSFPGSELHDLTFVSADSIYSAGGNGQIYLSVNKGETWSQQSTGTTNSLNAISFGENGVGFVAGDVGTILRTSDSGENWEILNSGVTTNLMDVISRPSNNNIVTAVGSDGTAIRSINGGNSFGRANLGEGNVRHLKQLKYLPNTNNVFSVGQDGYLILSANGGGSWTTRLAGIRNDFTDLDFKSDRFGFVAGEQGAVYVTGNAGVSIADRSLPEQIDILSIDFWNTGFGYVSGPSGRMFRTGNQGRSWVDVSAETEEAINGFYLFAPSVAYIAGSSGYIGRSFDSGGTWDSDIATNTTEDLRDVTFFDFQVGFAMGSNGQISWSNGGNEWENLDKLTTEDLNALAKVDSSTAVIVGDAGIILKGENKALDWRLISNDFTENINDVDFWDDNLGMAVGDNGFTAQTKDGGETWTQIPSGTRSDLSSISIGTPLVAFAAGEDGTLLNFICVQPGPLSEISGPTESCLGIQEYSIEDPQVEGALIQWRVDGGEIIEGQGTSRIRVDWNTLGRNAVLVTNENFCGNGETSALEVDVNTLPASNISIEGTAVTCIGETIEYRITELTDMTYEWSVFGGEIISGQNTSKIDVEWTEDGINQISLKLINSCGETDLEDLAIQVNATPEQPSEIQGESIVGIGEQIYSIEGVERTNYTWEISGVNARVKSGQGSEQVTIDWEEEGDAQITVIPRNECDSGEAQVLDVLVNIITSLESPINGAVKIFPNPSQGNISIELDDLNKWQEIEIWSVQGSLVRRIKIRPGQNNIRVENLPRGVNLVQLISQKEIVMERVIIQ